MITLLKSTLSAHGGAEKYALRLAKALTEKFGQLTLITSGKAPCLDPSIKVVTDTSRAWLSFKRVQAYDALCKEYTSKHPTRYIFSLDRNSHQTHIRASNGVHAAYLDRRSFHDPLWKRISYAYNPLHTQILRLEKAGFESAEVEKIFTNSHMVAQEILNHYSVDPKKIQVVHNGVEWETLKSSFEKAEYNTSEVCNLLFVGNGYHRKGLPFLLHSLSLIKDKSFCLSVIGKDKNIPSFVRSAWALGLKDKVRFYGGQQDLIPFYQKADLVIIPSIYDPFANVTLEALAMGVFVLSSTSNGACEILNPSNGISFHLSQSPEYLASLLNPLIQKRKTPEKAQAIRASVHHLDFSSQLTPLLDL